MYETFYGLSGEPFPVTPNPDGLFLGESHKAALAALIYGVERRRGFVQIVGEVGTGKTTLLRAFLNAIDPKTCARIVVLDPHMTFSELLSFVATELGVNTDADGYELVSRVHDALVREFRAGRNVVLVIDEAQNLPLETLEQIRMLSNVETDDTKLIQIVFAGQPELDEILQRHELRQLRQRIGVRAELLPLAPKEAQAYLAHRIEAAEGQIDAVLTPGARAAICAHAQGSPRALNIAADAVLACGLGANERPVSRGTAAEAIRALVGEAPKAAPRWGIAAAIGAAMVAVGVLGWYAADISGGRDVAAEVDAGVQEKPPEGAAVAPPAAAPADERERPTTRRDGLLMAASLQRPPAAPRTAPRPPKVAPEPAPVPARDEATYSTVDDARARHARIRASAEPLPDDYLPVMHEIQRGDLISTLCIDVYGFASDELYRYLEQANPALANVDQLEVGQSVVFPSLPRALERQRHLYVSAKLRQRNARAALDGSRP